MSECSPAAAARVLCPLCEHGFPADEIEVHAMYCNGIAAPRPGHDTPGLPSAASTALLLMLTLPSLVCLGRQVLHSCLSQDIWRVGRFVHSASFHLCAAQESVVGGSGISSTSCTETSSLIDFTQ